MLVYVERQVQRTTKAAAAAVINLTIDDKLHQH